MHPIAHLVDGRWLCPPCADRATAAPDPETTAVVGDETDMPMFCAACASVLPFGLTSAGQQYVWAEVVAAVAGAASRRGWFDIARAVGLGGAEESPVFRRRDVCDAWFAYALRLPPDDARRASVVPRLGDLGYVPSSQHHEWCCAGCGFVGLSANGRAILARLEASRLDDAPSRARVNLRLATGCGHRLPTPPVTGATGYGTSSATGYTYCYSCLDAAERITMASADHVHAYVGGGEVTTWTGGVLGRVVAKRIGAPHGSRFGFFRIVSYRVRDLDGALWHGRTSDSAGTLVHLRRLRAS